MKANRIRFTRRHMKDWQKVQLVLMALEGSSRRPQRVQCAIDRCTAPPDMRADCERLCYSLPFAGSNARYCSRPDDHPCSGRRRSWRPSPVPVYVSPAQRGYTFAGNEATREIVDFIKGDVEALIHDEDPILSAAAFAVRFGDWGQFDRLHKPTTKRPTINRRREQGQEALCRRISADYDRLIEERKAT